ncbi:MAG TPA: hypothetical protein VHY58_03785 [Streptosporangiaceae bacterium]|jgi:hypothetical protein|nr:hypothetical protein [Streptosporangiaceae bacterium]
MRAPSDTPLARAALALYPPAWRARYADEVRALLDESGGSARAIASIAWRALPAWVRPPEHLFDRPARMRSSLATALVAAAMLTGLGLVFAQLTEAQGYRPAGHPIVGWSYVAFDAALAVSALIAAVGGLPLWLLMLRSAVRERRRRDLAYLLLPAIAAAAYLVVLKVVVMLVGGPDEVSPSWFLTVTLLGFVAAAVAAAGPGLALRRMQPRGPALRLAAVAAGLAAAIMLVAAVASAVASVGLVLWAPGFAAYHEHIVPGVYLALVAAAATVTAVSAARGTRAAVADISGG